MDYIDREFIGGVIYIDLRGYTRIVGEKVLKNVANIIYNYQNNIHIKVSEYFAENTISTIEYVGDGVMIIIEGNNSFFNKKLFDGAIELKNYMKKKLQDEKMHYSGIDKLDFGMAISSGKIYERNINNKNDKRKMFFSQSLNRATKIGDVMNYKKNHLGIDKSIYNDIEMKEVFRSYEKETNPIVHKFLKIN